MEPCSLTDEQKDRIVEAAKPLVKLLGDMLSWQGDNTELQVNVFYHGIDIIDGRVLRQSDKLKEESMIWERHKYSDSDTIWSE